MMKISFIITKNIQEYNKNMTFLSDDIIFSISNNS